MSVARNFIQAFYMGGRAQTLGSSSTAFPRIVGLEPEYMWDSSMTGGSFTI